MRTNLPGGPSGLLNADAVRLYMGDPVSDEWLAREVEAGLFPPPARYGLDGRSLWLVSDLKVFRDTLGLPAALSRNAISQNKWKLRNSFKKLATELNARTE